MKPLLEAAFLTLCLSPLLALAISFSSTDAQQDLTTELSKDWGKNPTSNVHLDLREMDRKKAGGSTRVAWPIAPRFASSSAAQRNQLIAVDGLMPKMSRTLCVFSLESYSLVQLRKRCV
jgi:hypothetical protein